MPSAAAGQEGDATQMGQPSCNRWTGKKVTRELQNSQKSPTQLADESQLKTLPFEMRKASTNQTVIFGSNALAILAGSGCHFESDSSAS
jgi:hypothetical protein